MRFEVLRVGLMKIQVFQNVTPCRLFDPEDVSNTLLQKSVAIYQSTWRHMPHTWIVDSAAVRISNLSITTIVTTYLFPDIFPLDHGPVDVLFVRNITQE
jgi:hypothetical protein